MDWIIELLKFQAKDLNGYSVIPTMRKGSILRVNVLKSFMYINAIISRSVNDRPSTDPGNIYKFGMDRFVIHIETLNSIARQ